jgi:hypothetical protein
MSNIKSLRKKNGHPVATAPRHGRLSFAAKHFTLSMITLP